MKRACFAVLASVLTLPVVAAAETWKGVPVIDTQCLSRVKDKPDTHTTKCALQCSKEGYGLLTPDGAYLKFDAAGNEKTIAALKGTKKADHLRATVVGDKEGETIKVSSISIE